MELLNYKYILLPVIGAIIGLFTNYLAIRMLFRPYKEKRIFGIRIPFTPGVIPKEHDKLAVKIGEAVGNHLVTPESLHELFTTDSVKDKINSALDGMYAQFGMLAAWITPEIKTMVSGKVIEMLDKELPEY